MYIMHVISDVWRHSIPTRHNIIVKVIWGGKWLSSRSQLGPANERKGCGYPRHWARPITSPLYLPLCLNCRPDTEISQPGSQLHTVSCCISKLCTPLPPPPVYNYTHTLPISRSLTSPSLSSPVWWVCVRGSGAVLSVIPGWCTYFPPAPSWSRCSFRSASAGCL